MPIDPKTAALNAAADAILTEYRKSYHRDGRDLVEHYNSVLGDSVWGHSAWAGILTGKKLLSIRDKLTLIGAHRFISANLLFDEVFRRIGFTNRRALTNIHDGYYRYWRYYYEDHKHEEVLRWGIVKMSTETELETSFQHWSYDAIDEIKGESSSIKEIISKLGRAEDEGIAIYTDLKIFMLGFRKNNIRLSIADVPKGDPHSNPINGVVLTNKNNAIVYSAAFVMFHEKSKEFEMEITKKRFRDLQIAQASADHLTISHK